MRTQYDVTGWGWTEEKQKGKYCIDEDFERTNDRVGE